MKAHRTLIIKRPLRLFTEEEKNALVRVLTRVDALGNLWARGFTVYPPDLDSRFVYAFNYFKSEISFSNGVKPPKVWFAKVHAMLNVGLRLNNERDKGEGVFIDLTSNVLRLRWVIKRRAITINLTPSEVRYIRERLGEDGRPKLARAWIDGDYLKIAIAFEREVQPIQPSEYMLVIDVNSWRNGIVWALIKDGSISSLGRGRPWLRRIDRLYNEVLRLEQEYGKLRRLGLHKSVKGRRLWREIKMLRRKLYAYTRDYAQKIAHKLVMKPLGIGPW
ncbi:transposase [Vulcanisaeta sp. JCM 14467]|uniref:transposase n=1 Tax=Vulcanisaeta sp. JCM 14467 TaxID=1295370 RepID=UPI000A4ADF15|nr:transposase [Vulcanisaeta sp. JCM 14467]